MSCPSCKKPIDIDHVDKIADEVEKLNVLRSETQVQAMKICKKEGLDKDERLRTPGDFYFNNLMAFTEAKASFYMCSRCEKPYYGGTDRLRTGDGH